VRCRANFVDPHALHAVAKLLAIHVVTVAQEIGGRGVVRERVRGADQPDFVVTAVSSPLGSAPKCLRSSRHGRTSASQ
jgi:hypothetical protein